MYKIPFMTTGRKEQVIGNVFDLRGTELVQAFADGVLEFLKPVESTMTCVGAVDHLEIDGPYTGNVFKDYLIVSTGDWAVMPSKNFSHTIVIKNVAKTASSLGFSVGLRCLDNADEWGVLGNIQCTSSATGLARTYVGDSESDGHGATWTNTTGPSHPFDDDVWFAVTFTMGYDSGSDRPYMNITRRSEDLLTTYDDKDYFFNQTTGKNVYSGTGNLCVAFHGGNYLIKQWSCDVNDVRNAHLLGKTDSQGSLHCGLNTNRWDYQLYNNSPSDKSVLNWSGPYDNMTNLEKSVPAILAAQPLNVYIQICHNDLINTSPLRDAIIVRYKAVLDLLGANNSGIKDILISNLSPAGRPSSPLGKTADVAAMTLLIDALSTYVMPNGATPIIVDNHGSDMNNGSDEMYDVDSPDGHHHYPTNHNRHADNIKSAWTKHTWAI